MAHDSISNWVEKAKSVDGTAAKTSGVKVIRREETKSKGAMIMDIAEKMFPKLLKLLKDSRDESGLALQPAHVRGMAINIAENLFKNREIKEKQKLDNKG